MGQCRCAGPAHVRSSWCWRVLPSHPYPPSMGRLIFRKRHDSEGEPENAPEDPVVRQYRYLLRTAPADALAAAHAEAIPLLSEAHHESLLETIRATLLVGDHLTSTDDAKIAHPVINAEQRSPGQLLTALPAKALQALAASVLGSEASFGLLSGYAQWNGAEPEHLDDSAYEGDGFDANAGKGKTKRLGADGGGALGMLP